MGECAVISAVAAFCATWLGIGSFESLDVFNITCAVRLDACPVTIVKDPIIFNDVIAISIKCAPGSCSLAVLGASDNFLIGGAPARILSPVQNVEQKGSIVEGGAADVVTAGLWITPAKVC